MPFSQQELQAMEANPIHHKSTQRRAAAISELLMSHKPFTKQAKQLLLREFVENDASRVILTSRRDLDVGTALFRFTRTMGEMSQETLESIFLKLVMLLSFKRWPDSNAWQAILQLIDEARSSRRTYVPRPPRPTGLEIAEDISPSEFQPNVLRGVKDFVHRQFKTDDWHLCRRELVATVLKQHIDGKWAGFPDDTRKANVFEWLRSLQNDCFPDAAYTVSRKRFPDKFDPDKRGNAGIFFDSGATFTASERTYQKVSVVAHHKASYDKCNFKLMYQKLTHHVKKVFVEEPLRAFVHGFAIQGDVIEFWVFDRSGAYSSGELSIHENPESVAYALVAYATMTDEEMGRLEILQETDDTTDDTKYIQLNAAEDSKTLRNVPITHLIRTSSSIASRATFCYSSPEDGVVKLAWRGDDQRREHNLLLMAREKQVKGVATIMAWRELARVTDHRSRHNFEGTAIYHLRRMAKAPGVTSSATTGAGVYQYYRFSGKEEDPDGRANSCNPYYQRTLTAVYITPEGTPISKYYYYHEMVAALKDATRAHRSLLEAGILHRDISPANILMTKPTTENAGFRGMLIDLDMAEYTGGRGSATSNGQTGTLEFMAWGILHGQAHTYLHDLESFLYVLIWLLQKFSTTRSNRYSCVREEASQMAECLVPWTEGSMRDRGNAKQALMTDIVKFDELLSEILDSRSLNWKNLCREIRYVLSSARSFPSLYTCEDIYDAIDQAYEVALKPYFGA